MKGITPWSELNIGSSHWPPSPRNLRKVPACNRTQSGMQPCVMEAATMCIVLPIRIRAAALREGPPPRARATRRCCPCPSPTAMRAAAAFDAHPNHVAGVLPGAERERVSGCSNWAARAWHPHGTCTARAREMRGTCGVYGTCGVCRVHARCLARGSSSWMSFTDSGAPSALETSTENSQKESHSSAPLTCRTGVGSIGDSRLDMQEIGSRPSLAAKQLTWTRAAECKPNPQP